MESKAPYEVVYYKLPDGSKPVKEFVDRLDQFGKKWFFFKRKLLIALGPKLPFPHARPLGKGLFELRFKDKNRKTRIYYFFWFQETAVLVHASQKQNKQ